MGINSERTISFGRLLVRTNQGPAVDKTRITDWVDQYRQDSMQYLKQYKNDQDKILNTSISSVSVEELMDVERLRDIAHIEKNRDKIASFFKEINVLARYYIAATIASIHSFDKISGNYVMLDAFHVKCPNTEEVDRFGDNCYEFATGDAFSPGSLYDLIVNPGFTCKNSTLYKNVHTNRIEMGLAPAEEDWFTLMKKDLATVKKKLYRVDPGTPVGRGRIRMAAVYGANVHNRGVSDYHFYRYFPAYGYWAHKEGCMPVNALDSSGQLIKDVRKCVREGRTSGYDHIIGFYEIE